jgi:hypothetical protein
VINTLHKSDVLNEIQQLVMTVPVSSSSSQQMQQNDEIDNLIKIIQQTIK